MKKLFKVLGIAATIATVLGFGMIGCSDDTYDEAVVAENMNPSTDAKWDFSNSSAAKNEGSDVGFGAVEIKANGTVEAANPTGATLTFTGKGKYVKADDAKDVPAHIQASASSSASVSTYDVLGKGDGQAGIKATLTLKAKKSAVSFEVFSANTKQEASKCLVVVEEGEGKKPVLAIDSANGVDIPGSGAFKKYILELSAGTWNFYFGGIKFANLQAKSDDFVAETVYIINKEKEASDKDELTYLGMTGAEILPDYDSSVVSVTIGKAKDIKKPVIADNTPIVTVKAKKAGSTTVTIVSAVTGATATTDGSNFSVSKFEVNVGSDGKVKIGDIKTSAFAQMVYDLKAINVVSDAKYVLTPEYICVEEKDACKCTNLETCKTNQATGTCSCAKAWGWRGVNTGSSAVVAYDGAFFDPCVMITGLAGCFTSSVDIDDPSKTDKSKLSVKRPTKIQIVKDNTKAGSCIKVDGSKLTALEMGSTVITIYDGANSTGNKQDITVTVAADGSMSFSAGVAPYVAGSTEVLYKHLSYGAKLKNDGITSITKTYGSIVAFENDEENKKIKISACEIAGTATINVDAKFIQPDGTTEVSKTIPIKVTVNADGSVSKSVGAYCAYPYYFDKKVTRIYSMQLTDKLGNTLFPKASTAEFNTAVVADTDTAAVKADKNKVINLGKGFVQEGQSEAPTVVEFVNNNKIKVDANEKTYDYGSQVDSYEYRLSTGGATDKEATAIKLKNLAVGDYVAVVFVAKSTGDKIGLGAPNATEASKTDFATVECEGVASTTCFFITKIETAGDYFLNYANGPYIFAIEVYRDKPSN